jgi:hypothetical protein
LVITKREEGKRLGRLIKAGDATLQPLIAPKVAKEGIKSRFMRQFFSEYTHNRTGKCIIPNP